MVVRGPMFRHERQQRGGTGSSPRSAWRRWARGPRIDAEQIEMLDRWLRALASRSRCTSTRWAMRNAPAYRRPAGILAGAFGRAVRGLPQARGDEPHSACSTARIRSARRSRPARRGWSSSSARVPRALRRVRAALGRLGVAHVVDPKLVRGLDYYTRTTYEAIATSGLGSQSTVAEAPLRRPGGELGGGECPASVRRRRGAAGAPVAQAGGSWRFGRWSSSRARPREARADALALELRKQGSRPRSVPPKQPGKQMKRPTAGGAVPLCWRGGAEVGRGKLKELKTAPTRRRSVRTSAALRSLRHDPAPVHAPAVQPRFLGPRRRGPTPICPAGPGRGARAPLVGELENRRTAARDFRPVGSSVRAPPSGAAVLIAFSLPGARLRGRAAARAAAR